MDRQYLFSSIVNKLKAKLSSRFSHSTMARTTATITTTTTTTTTTILTLTFCFFGDQFDRSIFSDKNIINTTLATIVEHGKLRPFFQVAIFLVKQGCTTQISSGPKIILGPYPRARINISVPIQRVFFQANRLN